MHKRKIFPFIMIIALLLLAEGPKPAYSSDMARSQKGKILLQVEAKGEAWYVSPADEKRYYMGRPDDAFSLMRQLGVGITNADLKKIGIGAKNFEGPDSDGDGLSDIFEDAIGTDKNDRDSDNDGYDDKTEALNGYDPLGSGKMPIDQAFANRQKGRILLQVENNGEAWYVSPADGLRYFMGRPLDAFNLMRGLGLGITNQNLEKIPLKGAAPETAAGDLPAAATGAGDLGAIITAHQAAAGEYFTAYDEEDFARMAVLRPDVFSAAAQADALESYSDFMMDFVLNSLSLVLNADLAAEYEHAADNNEALPFEKTDEETIIVGLGIEDAIPYELKQEGGAWKIDLDFAQSYYAEAQKINDLEAEAEGSEVEIYVMDKIETALKNYKKKAGRYPVFIQSAFLYYPAAKNFDDQFYYAVSTDGVNCHIGIDVFEDETKLAKDADFDSDNAGYIDGFDGVDPIYDVLLN